MNMRAFARRVRDGYRKSLQRAVLRRSLATLQRTLQEGKKPSPRLMQQLVHGWGNEAWSAGSTLLLAMLEWLPRTSGTIAECGSGLSTLTLATAGSLSGRRVHCFEHSEDWAARVIRELPDHLRSTVELHVTPIRSYGEFDWYSLDSITPPREIGFVVCDGPPGDTRGGRYGLAPLLRSQLAPGCIILVDDTQRPGEHDIVSRWCSELGGAVIHEGSTYSVFAVGDSP